METDLLLVVVNCIRTGGEGGDGLTSHQGGSNNNLSRFLLRYVLGGRSTWLDY